MPVLTQEKIAEVLKRYKPYGYKHVQSKGRVDGRVNFSRKEIYTPIVKDVETLHIYLHECAHVFNRHYGLAEVGHVEEFEAEVLAFSFLRQEGIRIPRAVLNEAKAYVLSHVERDESKGLVIWSYVKKWATRKDK